MGHPDVRYPNGTEVVPQIDLRDQFELYAGIRPIRVLPGRAHSACGPARARHRLRDRPRVHGRAVRGADREPARRRRGRPRHDAHHAGAAASGCSRRRSRSPGAGGAAAARPEGHLRRQGQRAAVDGVLPRVSFSSAPLAIPTSPPTASTSTPPRCGLVRAPWDLDVLVTENMFGDILSDLGAGLMGGMGMAPSADVGDRHAVFQPCHGTAPDIAGRGLANPTAMFLSAAMMLDWLGDRHSFVAVPSGRGGMLTSAVERAFADGTLVPVEHGGSAGTAEIADVCASGPGERSLNVRLDAASTWSCEKLGRLSDQRGATNLMLTGRRRRSSKPVGVSRPVSLIDAEDDDRIRPLIAGEQIRAGRDRCRSRAASSPASDCVSTNVRRPVLLVDREHRDAVVPAVGSIEKLARRVDQHFRGAVVGQWLLTSAGSVEIVCSAVSPPRSASRVERGDGVLQLVDHISETAAADAARDDAGRRRARRPQTAGRWPRAARSPRPTDRS